MLRTNYSKFYFDISPTISQKTFQIILMDEWLYHYESKLSAITVKEDCAEYFLYLIPFFAYHQDTQLTGNSFVLDNISFYRKLNNSNSRDRNKTCLISRDSDHCHVTIAVPFHHPHIPTWLRSVFSHHTLIVLDYSTTMEGILQEYQPRGSRCDISKRL